MADDFTWGRFRERRATRGGCDRSSLAAERTQQAHWREDNARSIVYRAPHRSRGFVAGWVVRPSLGLEERAVTAVSFLQTGHSLLLDYSISLE